MKRLSFSLALLATLAGCADKQDGPTPAAPKATVSSTANLTILPRSQQGYLLPDQYMDASSVLESSQVAGGVLLRSKFYIQYDGNVVLYDFSFAPNKGNLIWNSGTANQGGSLLVMQTDGNLVLYDTRFSPWRAVWHTSTYGNPGAYMWLTPSGGAYIVSADGRLLKGI